jgi:hypothetical protein
MTNPTRRYYGGAKATTKAIRQLNATDFQSLVLNYFNVPVSIPVTRQQYQSMAPDEQFDLKNGPYILCATMREGASERSDANAERMVMVMLDLDTPANGDSSHLRDLASDPKSMLAGLYPFNCLIHTTASSTDEHPRLRVLVDADIPVDRLRSAVRSVARRLGIPKDFKGVRESTVISQPSFRPVVFSGEAYTSVLASRTSGEVFTVDAIEDIDEDGSDHDRTYAWISESITCGLDQLPVPGVSVDDVREIMRHLDPGMTYHEWVKVAASLRHQFRDEDEAREAYSLFDEWSALDPKYKGEAETYAKWASFKPDTIDKRGVTIRTLFHHAIANGWKPNKVAAKVQQSFADWLAETDDHNILMDEGCQRIMAMPFRSELVEEGLIETLRQRIRKCGGPSIDKAVIRRQLSKVKFSAARENDDTGDLPAWLRPWCFYGPEDVFVHTTQGVSTALSPGAFDRMFGRELMGEEPTESGHPAVQPSMLALNLKKIKRVSGVIYDPRNGGDDPYFSLGGVDYLNSYNPASAPLPVKSRSGACGRALQEHLRIIIAEEEYAELVLQYMAHVVQRPGIKIRWIPVIQSAEGAGKSIIGTLMKSVLGRENVKGFSPGAHKSGPWNDMLFDAQWVNLEELRVHGSSRVDVMNMLKEWITNDEVPKIEKYKNTKLCLNVANGMAFTNYHDAIYLEESNRRYMVIKSPLQSKKQIDDLTESGHFERLMKVVTEHPGAMRYFLLNYPIPEAFPTNGPAPKTKYTQEMIEQSKNKLHVALDRELSELPFADARDLNIRYEHLARNNHSVEHFLYVLGFQPSVDGFWTHRERFDPVTDSLPDRKKSENSLTL